MSGLFLQNRYHSRFLRVSNSSAGLFGDSLSPTNVEGIFEIKTDKKTVGVHIDFNFVIDFEKTMTKIQSSLDLSPMECQVLHDFLIYHDVQPTNTTLQ